jgi:hypothetical protein
MQCRIRSISSVGILARYHKTEDLVVCPSIFDWRQSILSYSYPQSATRHCDFKNVKKNKWSLNQSLFFSIETLCSKQPTRRDTATIRVISNVKEEQVFVGAKTLCPVCSKELM